MQAKTNNLSAFLSVIVVLLGVCLPVMAQEAQPSIDPQKLLEQFEQLRQQVEKNPEMLEQLKQQLPDGGVGLENLSTLDPNMLGALGALSGQNFSLKDLLKNQKSTCKDSKFLTCKSGYGCTSKEKNGESMSIHIKGWHGEKCHVQMVGQDGSKGECLYTKPTLKTLYDLHQGKEVAMDEAMAIAQKISEQCHFTMANGNPILDESIKGE